MEQDKYYTPAIEDLFVGYEGEINWNRGYDDIWVPFKIKVQDENSAYTSELSEIINAVHDGMSEIRTPFLTKEQIEQEGWAYSHVLIEDTSGEDIHTLGWDKYESDGVWYTLVDTETGIKIWKKWYVNQIGQAWKVVYDGQCKSINEFRKITKWLGI